MQGPLKILEKYFGHTSFRKPQENIIASVLEGKDTLAILPTGSGKSVCFQVPALMLEGMCLVITPLVALMHDQVQNLKNKNIPAAAMHSGMSFYELRKTLVDAVSGQFKFLYVSPERLETNLFKEYLPALNINLIAVDEAHCVSQWGYDFRPPYLRIANLREELKSVPCIALSASATAEVQKDILQKLHFSSPNIFHHSFERANLSYSVFKTQSKINKLVEILKNVKGSGIVYCRNRRVTKETALLLNEQNIEADFYHAGLPQQERNKKQQSWMNGTTRIIVCTNAFGMGIDKPDVRTVIHFDAPHCIENYYQEAGRAGRDNKKSYAVLLYLPEDIKELKSFADKRFPPIDTIRKIYQHLFDYLEIPSGSGEGNFYDFDIATFIKNFNLDGALVSNTIKALEQEGFISFNESIFLPSQINFTVDKNTLEDFEKTHPQFETLIKCLLRTYDSIFENRVSIFERQIAKLVKAPVDAVLQGLNELISFNIIEYLPQKDTPQIQLLMNRAPAKFLNINHENYLQRKKNYETRLSKMLEYIELENKCRSTFIANYFDDQAAKDCGICDNCLEKKKLVLSTEIFTKIQSEIIAFLTSNPSTTQALLDRLRSNKKEHIWKVIEHLQSERIITLQDNLLMLQKK